MRSVVFHGLLALLGLGFAYQTWTRRPEEEAVAPAAVVAQCTRDALQALRLDTPTHSVVVEPTRDARGTHYWITVQRKSNAELAGAKSKDQVTRPDDSQYDATKPAGSYDALAPRRFLAKSDFDKYLERITPLRAARALGVLPKAKLADFGFDEVGTHLELGCAGRKTVLDVGARTFGSGERYVRDPHTQLAFLFDDALIADLQAAQYKFMQSELQGPALSEVDEAVVSAHGKTKRLLHRDRKLAGRAIWVDAAAPARRNEVYGNWFERLTRLRVKDFLPPSAEPGSDLPHGAQAATPVLSVDYALAGAPRAKLELVRVDVGAASHYYARTDSTQTWVSVFDSSAKDVERDVALVVGSADADAASPAAAPASTPR